jgi:hypothetical protein
VTLTDSCPACCRRGIAPAAHRRRGPRIVHVYQCPGCGATWATTRDLAAYSELHAHTTGPTTRKAA